MASPTPCSTRSRRIVAAQHERIVAEHEAGGQRWMDLPSDTALADEIDAFAAEARARYRDFILIGIGGSSLGAIATIQALTHPYRNLLPAESRGGPRFFVLDNPDPEKVAATLATVDLPNTLVNVVTKSGQTAETMANFLVARQAWKRRSAGAGAPADRGHDRSEGGVAAAAGGPGGLPDFPGASRRRRADDGAERGGHAAGRALWRATSMVCWPGARAMRARAGAGTCAQNPAYLLAALAILADTRLGKSILVTMPYADALFGLSDWFRQLWAESLGKKLSLDNEVVFAGQTPIKALGAIDQHSQIQLYTEGPNDKLISLDRRRGVPGGGDDRGRAGGGVGTGLPEGRRAGAVAPTGAARDGMGADGGATAELHHLRAGDRRRDPRRVLLPVRVANGDGGGALNVNPFGQPGVEAGKNATYALMGRKGYEAIREELLGTDGEGERYRLRRGEGAFRPAL